MSKSLISPFTIPALPQLVIDRERLVGKLRVAVQKKLTLVIAPPGYGKTTLVAQFAQITEIPVVWHTLEEREQDVPSLFDHCLAIFASIFPEIAQVVQTSDVPDAESAYRLTEFLKDHLLSDAIYVMEDVHHLLDSPGAGAWLRTFIARIPSKLHIILIGRAAPKLPLAEMIAHQEVNALGADDLRFNFSEFVELAGRTGSNLSQSALHNWMAHLNGWPAGTLLALQPLSAELEAIAFQGRSGPEALFDALAETMIQSQSVSLRDFLLASSTLSRMTPAVCEGALGLSNSSRQLDEAFARNLFITHVAGGLAYHLLFREFLQTQLQRHNPERFNQLHSKAGHWFEQENRLEEAIEHYVTAQQWQDAAEIAERVAQTYLSQGKVETLLKWCIQLKESNLKTPRLHYVCASIFAARYQYDRVKSELTEAASGFEAQNNLLGLYQVRILEAHIQTRRGDSQSAINQILSLAHDKSVPDHVRGNALVELGMAYIQQGNVETALEYYLTALPLIRLTKDAFGISQLLLDLQTVYIFLGRFDDATSCSEEVAAINRKLGNSAGLAIALNNLGYQYHLSGDYQRAYLTFQEGLQAATHVPETRAESYILWSLGDLQRDRGAASEASSLYYRALQLTGNHEPTLKCGLLISLATLQRWQGDLQESLSFAEEAVKLAENYNLTVERLRAEVAVFAIHALQGAPGLAADKLEKLADSFQQRKMETRMCQTLGVLAQISLSHSDAAQANQYLKRALNAAIHPANLQPLVAEVMHSPRLKPHVFNHKQRFGTLCNELEKLQNAWLGADEQSRKGVEATDRPTLSLRIYVLGQERIERDGKPITVSAWRTARARKLFFYLVFNGAATRDQIGLMLWPDYSTEQVRDNFHTTLRRARLALGNDVILYEDERYFINPDLDIWCDTNQFEATIQQARMTSPLIAYTEHLWQHAIDLYKSDLLPSLDADWLTGYRESLHEEHLEALIALGNCIRVRGNAQEAIQVLKRAASIDPYREDIYRALMTCYADLGERTLVYQLMQELTQRLHDELGVTPSPETLLTAHSALN